MVRYFPGNTMTKPKLAVLEPEPIMLSIIQSHSIKSFAANPYVYTIYLKIIDSLVRTAERINEDDEKMCECLPSCSELEYDIEVNSTPRNYSMSKGKILAEYFDFHHVQ